MKKNAVFVVYPIDEEHIPDVLKALKDAGPHGELPQPKIIELPASSCITLTGVQQEIAEALTNRPLNERQVCILEKYLINFKSGGGHVDVDSVAKYLLENVKEVETQKKAVEFVKGSLRAFGKRLNGTLTKPPGRRGKDKFGDGVLDEVPLMAMIDFFKDAHGQTRHKLTEDGAAAIAMVLGAKASGMAASSTLQDGENENEKVGLFMTVKSAALLFRVAKEMGVTLDEAILSMTAAAGAG